MRKNRKARLRSPSGVERSRVPSEARARVIQRNRLFHSPGHPSPQVIEARVDRRAQKSCIGLRPPPNDEPATHEDQGSSAQDARTPWICPSTPGWASALSPVRGNHERSASRSTTSSAGPGSSSPGRLGRREHRGVRPTTQRSGGSGEPFTLRFNDQARSCGSSMPNSPPSAQPTPSGRAP